MSQHTYLERLRYIDDLIRRKATGDLKALSKKLHLSKSYTLKFLKELRSEGIPIKYSRKDNSYYYKVDDDLGNLLFKNDVRGGKSELSRDEMRNITGGKSFLQLFSKSPYMRPKDQNFALRNAENQLLK
ncbi:MAG: hypothetical protein J0H55_10480 [Chitinophagaceae bacterium]|nr:hypothetical protein [Chitinophagaceae bacterium]